MPRDDLKLNDRGFAQYGSGNDDHGNSWQVYESSVAGDLYVWVRAGSEESDVFLHLSCLQAQQLVEHLQRFLQDAADPEHWKNDPEYVSEWRDESTEDET